jgi:AcrR family transcriptional regulator
VINMGKRALTRERIVGRAVQLASTEGITGLTLGRLADSIGMSKSGLFAHFRSKEELQLQVLQATFDSFQRFVVEPAQATPSGEERFRVITERWIAWASDREEMPGGCLIVQAAAELDDQPGPPRDLLADAQRRWLETLAAYARSAVRVGAFREDLDPELFAFQLESILLGANHFHRLLHDPRAFTQARASIEALLASARRTTH